MTAFVLRSPLDLVALVPVVVGFHPRDSLVLLTFGGSAGGFHARADLPDPGEEQDVAAMLVSAALTNRAVNAAVLAYTDDPVAARRATAAVADALDRAGLRLLDRLRVHAGRYHSVPAEGGDEDREHGTPFDLDSHPLTAQRVLDGQVVHSSREELAATVAAADESVTAPVAAAFAECARWGAEADPVARAREARWVQRRVRRQLARGVPLPTEDAARLLRAVTDVGLRDVAWAQMDRERAGDHVDLWRDLVCRAPDAAIAPAAALLAFACWLAGDGALAWCALDRVAQADPDYSMAALVADVLQHAVPPSAWTPPVPGELPAFALDCGIRAC